MELCTSARARRPGPAQSRPSTVTVRFIMLPTRDRRYRSLPGPGMSLTASDTETAMESPGRGFLTEDAAAKLLRRPMPGGAKLTQAASLDTGLRLLLRTRTARRRRGGALVTMVAGKLPAAPRPPPGPGGTGPSPSSGPARPAGGTMAQTPRRLRVTVFVNRDRRGRTSTQSDCHGVTVTSPGHRGF